MKWSKSGKNRIFIPFQTINQPNPTKPILRNPDNKPNLKLS